MAKTIGRNTNRNDEAILSDPITLNDSTSVKVADADDNRIVFTFSNPSSKQVWLKFQAASTDDDKKGIVVFARSNYEMPTDNVYTGEISAIAESGTPDVYITEY